MESEALKDENGRDEGIQAIIQAGVERREGRRTKRKRTMIMMMRKSTSQKIKGTGTFRKKRKIL